MSDNDLVFPIRRESVESQQVRWFEKRIWCMTYQDVESTPCG